MVPPEARKTVSLVTLGCARNEVDSEELAARLDAAGWRVAGDADGADVVVVNTCGFIEPAKRDSIDVLLRAADSGAKVVAAGCMAERYGRELADALPETAAVLSFDDYTEIGRRLDDVLEGRPVAPHRPRDRRALLPVTPVDRRAHNTPGHGERPPGTPASGPPVLRMRLGEGPTAPVKLASGCDRRCTFCAIPSFRGAYVSRHPDEIVRDTEWLAGRGVREIFLVSENSSSYGKDLGDPRALESLLPRLAAVIDRVRVSYLQPAEMRPGLIEVMTGTGGVLPYFDLSFQHASGLVLRRMRRYGDRERFLRLLSGIRAAAPEAGVRSNFIVGFPGETETDVIELERFIEEARLDAIGVFAYSDEDGTAAAGLDGKVDPEVVQERLSRVTTLAEEVTAQRAEERVGATMDVLIESGNEGRAFHQAPETDGCVRIMGGDAAVGEVVNVKITGSEGVDLLAEALP